ncbi:MAG: MraY family glycosyltransferase [Hyphomicrobiales bacterium]
MPISIIFPETYFALHIAKFIEVFVTAFLVSFFLIPPVVRISLTKNLLEGGSKRRVHKKSIPNLGGFAIYTSFLLTTILFLEPSSILKTKFFLVSLIIIALIGMQDDIAPLSPIKKVFGQIVAIVIVLFTTDIQFRSLYGFLGIHELPQVISYIITALIILIITNAFNLMDGIDGLAAGLGIQTSIVMGIFFIFIHAHEWAILSLILAGGLVGFLYYNLFGTKNKIFMGDTGSLTIGFIISILAIQFNELNHSVYFQASLKSAPAVLFAILIIPICDIIKVFIFRVIRGKSPFYADRRHLHHYILQTRVNHFQATLIILLLNIVGICYSFLLDFLGTNKLILIDVVWGFLVVLSPNIYLRLRIVLYKLRHKQTKPIK